MDNEAFVKEHFNTELQPWVSSYDWNKIVTTYSDKGYKIRIYLSANCKQHVIDFLSADYTPERLEALKDTLTIDGKYFDCTEEGIIEAVKYCAKVDKQRRTFGNPIPRKPFFIAAVLTKTGWKYIADRSAKNAAAHYHSPKLVKNFEEAKIFTSQEDAKNRIKEAEEEITKKDNEAEFKVFQIGLKEQDVWSC